MSTDILISAAENVFQWHVLLIILLSAVYGIFMGAVPGLTATMAVALLVPLTFFLDDVPALAAIVTLEACAIFAGDLPTALVRIPGTPSSAAYVNDAYALTRKGRSLECLTVALVFSVGGGLFGAFVLMSGAPLLAGIAFHFTTYEFFWLILLGLSCGVFLSRGSLLKGLLALWIGLLLSMVGLSEVHGQPRFTFGRDELLAGINFIPAMIGLFGVSEVLRNLGALDGSQSEIRIRSATRSGRSALVRALSMLIGRKLSFLRSSLIGSAVGMLPGAGADIGAWISMGVSKRFSSRPEEYGEGSLEGISDATSANNSALAGSWIPALVFGIPGDSITAIVIGVLLMKNITPGPRIFADESQSILVYSIYLTFIVANLALIPVGLAAIRISTHLVRIPKRVLLPVILLFCLLGAYAINGSYFDVWVMLGMGVLGFVLESKDVPLGPVVLAVILGGRLEETFIHNLAKSTSLIAFFSRPVAAILGTACFLLWSWPLIRYFRADRAWATDRS